jgi:hypothetical protein
LLQLAFRKWCELAGHGPSHGYDLLAAGEVDSIMRGGRRYIIVSSWLDYVERQRLGIERDPIEKRRAQEDYRRSAQGAGGQAAARARAAIGKPPITELPSSNTSSVGPRSRNATPQGSRSVRSGRNKSHSGARRQSGRVLEDADA